MNTEILTIADDNIDGEKVNTAAELLKKGEVVAIPTETVYGLAADALNPEAVKKIFAAKGRPQDNPLIVHISEINEINKLVTEFTPKAQALAKAFWPGPMTIILKRSDIVPAVVSAGLDTVAVRMPIHPVARAIIKAAQTPLAAPSANISGSPSPTCFKYVYDDMNGKVAAIVDGGECDVGVESTVIDLTGETPNLLRPGGITYEQLKKVLGDVDIDKGVLDKINDNEKVSSPGMKYKHYAPNAEIVIVDADSDEYCKYVNSQGNAYALCFDEDKKRLTVPSVCYGNEKDDISQAKELFTALRRLDEIGAERVYARMPKRNGVGLAVYNRLIRAAAFQVIKP